MNAKRESERLMNEILPLAKKMLQEYGEFHPYGGYMKPDGEIVHVGVEDLETEYPKAIDLIYILRNSLQKKARANQCKATAIVLNIGVKAPGSGSQNDALQVSLDHIDGYSVEVFFPYQVINREVVYGEIFAQEGKHVIF